ncbi:MAG: 2Fe-2S iron-sulfur cluster binding domain-containing protein, partial [Nevskiaceae bacterium]|nr:2Fe-2S iron-sulfur cluster binding domain-containing protein [Nevskiaceae bacterium]
MPTVTYGGQAFECGEKQSVLECLTAAGIQRPSSCRSGTCQTCMMRAVSGSVPERAQKGLKSTLLARNCFLPCVCFPDGDMEIADLGDVGKLQGEVTSVEPFGGDILSVRIKPLAPFDYRAGQFIRFFKDDHTIRNYSLASVPALDQHLNLHVRRMPNGRVSNWMAEHLKVGDTVTISEASGDCLYAPGKPEQNILLIGTGS